MQALITTANDNGLEIQEREAASRFRNEAVAAYGTLTPSLCKSIKLLWKDNGIREAHEINKEMGAGYFFDGVDRLISPDYMATREDVLQMPPKVCNSIIPFFILLQKNILTI